MELLRERLCLDPVVLRAAILWGYCFTVSLFFSCQGVRVSEGGMLIKVVHRLFARGGCGLLVVQTFDVSACAAIVEGLPGLQLDWLDCMIS